jgi:hypothetical protein
MALKTGTILDLLIHTPCGAGAPLFALSRRHATYAPYAFQSSRRAPRPQTPLSFRKPSEKRPMEARRLSYGWWDDQRRVDLG